MKVVHVLYQSLPHISGSTIRSRDIIESQAKVDIEPVVVTSPFQKPFQPSVHKEVYHNIPYYRTFNNEGLMVNEGISKFSTKIKKISYIFSFTRKLYKICKAEKPDVIHAHATFFTAFSSKICSYLLKIPMVYEVRSLWDERQKQLATGTFQLLQLKVIRKCENAAINSADLVVTINDKLKKNLQSRVKGNREIFVIKNAASIPDNITEMKTDGYDHDKKQADYIFGYIGSVTIIEGLVFLTDVFSKINIPGIKLFIYGDGPETKQLQKLIEENAITNVVLRGMFSPEHVQDIYNEVDCIINPRTKNMLSETVTPLKPLEALAFKKLFIGSDVGGIKDLISHGKTGLLFKADDKESLLQLIQYVLLNRNSPEFSRIIEAGFAMVKKSYSWEANAIKYYELYQSLLQSKYIV
jgi:glycosyltransferase involved in cell wall biosynthesis